MPSSDKKKRWDDPHFRQCFSKERNGMVQHSVYGNRVMASPPLIWSEVNKRAALAQLRTLGDNYRANQNRPPASTIQTHATVKALIARFKQVRFAQLSDSAITGYESAFRLYLPHDLPLKQLDGARDDVAHLLIRDMIKTIDDGVSEVINDAGLCASTRKKYLVGIRSLFLFGIEEGMIVRNPVALSMIPDPLPEKSESVTDEHVQALIDEAAKVNKYIACFIEFQSLLATRIGEALKLKALDYKDNTLTIDGKRIKRNEPKIRRVAINLLPGARALLEKTTALAHEYGCYPKLFPWVNQSSIAYHLDPVIKSLKEEGRLPQSFTQHGLRKYAINVWEKQLLIPENVCERMAGHSHEVRRRHYDHIPTAEELERMAGHNTASPISVQ